MRRSVHSTSPAAVANWKGVLVLFLVVTAPPAIADGNAGALQGLGQGMQQMGDLLLRDSLERQREERAYQEQLRREQYQRERALQEQQREQFERERREREYANSQEGIMDKVRPGWREVAASPMFRDWMKMQSPEVQTKYNSPKMEDAIDVLSRYRVWVEDMRVFFVQKALSDMGYKVGPVDGKVGPATTTAIRQFQKSRGIEQDGEVDSVTSVFLPPH